jgi:hypothetical protein
MLWAVEMRTLVARAGKRIRREREAVRAVIFILILPWTALHRPAQAGWLRALVEAENVDLLVRIGKCGIAALATSSIALAERPRGKSAQRDCRNCKQASRREPKLRRSIHGFPQTRAPRDGAMVHLFACGVKAFRRG